MSLIATNLITGFLGVGKTTAINHLLRHKPAGETWSVLVNEFGEIGVDGALLDQRKAHVREVAGGCICCVAGLPMKIALNMLIATTKPDRVLIEPTGLGHPVEIINTLTGEYYDRVLDLRATITLVDPRKLADARYRDNATFNDQIAVADVLVANKTDLCRQQDLDAFNALSLDEPQPDRFAVEQGALQTDWLNLPRTRRTSARTNPHRNNLLQKIDPMYDPEISVPEGERFLHRRNSGDGHHSAGWIFRPEVEFDFNRLFALLSGTAAQRLKAVMITDRGVFSFNAEDGVLSVNELDDCLDSRVELIDPEPVDAESFQQQLLLAANG